jgi:hypothetical protein
VHLHKICALVNVREKTILFMVYPKKRKNILWKALFLALNFVLLDTLHEKLIFRKTTLQACITWRCTCKFFVSIFLQSKCKIHFKIKGAYAFLDQNITPQACTILTLDSLYPTLHKTDWSVNLSIVNSAINELQDLSNLLVLSSRVTISELQAWSISHWLNTIYFI